MSTGSMRRRLFLALGVGLAPVVGACVVGFDSGPRETDLLDAGFEAATLADVVTIPTDAAEASVEAAAPTTFAFDDENNWEDHELAGTFAGAAFDGRYVYFVPRGQLTLWRYDTTAGFNDASAWASVTLPAGASSGYAGAAFAGGYVYLAPSAPNLSVLRYPVAAPFAAASWELFALDGFVDKALSPDFLGVAAYGGGIYFISRRSGLLAHYDPTKTFTDAAAWVVAAPTLPEKEEGAFGGSIATDGGLYLVPAQRTLTLFKGGPLNAPASFESGPVINGDYLGGATDGVHLFFVPNGIPTAATMDVGLSLTTKALQPMFPLEAFASCGVTCFAGAVFDGRYVYFVPRNRARFVRHDVLGGFSDALSWSVGRPDAGNTSFFGGAFDGRYVYFVPDGAGRVVRFHAREPAAMPASYAGSFL